MSAWEAKSGRVLQKLPHFFTCYPKQVDGAKKKNKETVFSLLNTVPHTKKKRD